MKRYFGFLIAIGMVVGMTIGASGQSIGTQRALRNINLALSLEIAEPFKTGIIPAGKEFEAQTLVKDLDDRLKRARAEYGRIEDADKSLPAVIEVGKRLEEMERIQGLMKTAVAGQAERDQKAKEMHFAFLAEFEKCLQSVTTIGALAKDRERDVLAGASPEKLTKIMADLASIAEGCATKYQGIRNHPTYSIPDMLNTCPGDICTISTMRDTFALRAVINHVGAIAGRMIQTLREIKKSVDSENGFLDSWEANVVNAPEEFKNRLVNEATPWFAAIGRPVPEGYFAPFDPILADAVAAVDSAATKWTYPDDKFSDAKIDGIVRRQMASGVTVIRTSLTHPQPTIIKNDLGIILSRVRSGHILFKMPNAKWCSLRSFDYVESYAGGGEYQTPSSATLSEAVRFQACR